jgi:hypothetical protein
VDPAVTRAARELGLGRLVEHVNYLEHQDALQCVQRAALLLLVINRVQGAEGILTGKLFEYVGSGRPVLGLGPETGDASRVLDETGAGSVFGFDAVDEVAATIERHYAAWQQGQPLQGAPLDRRARYSRRAQAEELAAVLESVATTRTEESRVS